MSNGKLRVGLLVDGMELAAWAHRMVELIVQGDYAAIVVIVQRSRSGAMTSAPSANDAAGSMEFGKSWNPMVRSIALAAQRFLVGKPCGLPDASRLVDASALLAGVEVINVVPRRDQGSDHIDGGDLARIKAFDLDVFVQLGFGSLQGGILESARHGVWRCDYRNERTQPGGVPGWREVMESRPVTGSTLSIVKGGSGGAIVAYRSYASTNVMSLSDNSSNVQWKSLHFVPRKLEELQRDGGEAFFARLRQAGIGPPFWDQRSLSDPTAAEFGVLLWKKALQKIRRKWDDAFYFQQWFLLYDIRDGLSTSLRNFKPILPPKDRFWADPFVVARDDRYYVFIEECLYAGRKGHISLLVLNKDGSFEPPVPVLETSYHLSYPFIFEFEGGLYMIPESAANRTVDLYRCTGFPRKWEFQGHLRENLQAVDTTLFEWQGKWWMFANEVRTKGASSWDELFLYYSDSPLSGEWIPHPRNPVVSDVRSARPAGRLFVRNGRLYRPSQNCAGHYGYGFNLCEITRMTETDYEERVADRVEPGWDPSIVSTHTLNHEAGLTIIDGQLLRRR